MSGMYRKQMWRNFCPRSFIWRHASTHYNTLSKFRKFYFGELLFRSFVNFNLTIQSSNKRTKIQSGEWRKNQKYPKTQIIWERPKRSAFLWYIAYNTVHNKSSLNTFCLTLLFLRHLELRRLDIKKDENKVLESIVSSSFFIGVPFRL